MAQAGEIEVFRISPEVGKCYEYVEATRSVYLGGGNHRYFSRNKPVYVGTFVRQVRYGYGNGGEVHAIFNKGGEEITVKYSYEGYTCFIEVDCKTKTTEGGRRKRKHTSKRKNNKKSKTRSRK